MKRDQNPSGMFELQNAKNIRPDLSKQKQQIKKPVNKKEGEKQK